MDRRSFLKLFGSTAAAVAAPAVVDREYAALVPDAAACEAEEGGGQGVCFRVAGDIKKMDFVTIADGGMSVRRGGFDCDEIILGVVTEVNDDGTCWVAMDV